MGFLKLLHLFLLAACLLALESPKQATKMSRTLSHSTQREPLSRVRGQTMRLKRKREREREERRAETESDDNVSLGGLDSVGARMRIHLDADDDDEKDANEQWMRSCTGKLGKHS